MGALGRVVKLVMVEINSGIFSMIRAVRLVKATGVMIQNSQIQLLHRGWLDSSSVTGSDESYTGFSRC